MASSDEALLVKLIGGDLGAFDALYERHARALFGYIRRDVRDTSEAEDLLHETFLSLLKDRERARTAYSLRAWLFQVTRNLCLNHLRSRRRSERALAQVARTPVEPPPSPDELISRFQERETLNLAVGALPPEMAELFALRSAGLTYEELAQVLEIPLGTVKSRMHQLMKSLREEVLR